VVTSDGQALRFPDDEVRSTGRDGQGVNAIALKSGGTVVGALFAANGTGEDLVVVSEQGMGKRTSLDQFPQRHRATGGVTAITLVRSDKLAVATLVGVKDDLILASGDGVSAQLSAKTMRRQGRATKGSKLLTVGSGDRVTTIARLAED
jgi:DNA gyrase subunit A